MYYVLHIPTGEILHSYKDRIIFSESEVVDFPNFKCLQFHSFDMGIKEFEYRSTAYLCIKLWAFKRRVSMSEFTVIEYE
jgi:hypothetical protein